MIDPPGQAVAERLLIVNGDDFGRTPGINRGVVRSYEQGILTSANLMVRWPAAAGAGAYCRKRTALSLGLHLDLGEWVFRDGTWHCLYQVVDPSDSGSVRNELRTQLEAFRTFVGRDPSHLDSHQHVHLHEPVRTIVLEESQRLQVAARGCSSDISYCGDFYGQSGAASRGSLLCSPPRVARRAVLLREIQTYQRILRPARLGTAMCDGAVTDQAAGRHWLSLEEVPGRELYQEGGLDVWVQVAGWLARMHSCAALRVDSVQQRNPHLVSYYWAYDHRWLDRAKSFHQNGGQTDQEVLNVVGERLCRALRRLAFLSPTFLHGKFYASNILIGEGLAGRICPVDWEMAGIGPGLLDLAALCTGWAEEQQRAVALGYYRGLGQGAEWLPDEREFLSLLRCCQLCLAVQWLGWAPNWVAPPEHARDWLLEASRLAEGVVS